MEINDKTIDKIQCILQSKEVKNLSVQATGNINDLAMTLRDKGTPRKRKVISQNKYYNYYKFEYFERNYFLPNTRVNRNTQQSWKEKLCRRKKQYRSHNRRWNDTLNQVYQALENKSKHDNNSNTKPFIPRPIGSVFIIKKQKFQKYGTNSIWFLDSYTSHHFCNN